MKNKPILAVLFALFVAGLNGMIYTIGMSEWLKGGYELNYIHYAGILSLLALKVSDIIREFQKAKKGK